MNLKVFGFIITSAPSTWIYVAYSKIIWTLLTPLRLRWLKVFLEYSELDSTKLSIHRIKVIYIIVIYRKSWKHEQYLFNYSFYLQITHSEEWNGSVDMALLPGLCRRQKHSFRVALFNESSDSIHIYECDLRSQRSHSQTNGLPQQNLLSNMVEIHSCLLPHGAIPQVCIAMNIVMTSFEVLCF